jgi:hypothetical protein
LDSFDGVERAQNRDAFDFAFRARTGPTTESRLLIVRFSGTVMSVRPETFGLPAVGDRQMSFRTFAEAAIGDSMDESGSLELALPDDRVRIIDCFSPHFQAWHDRRPSTDDEVEDYLFAHALASWDFGLRSWVLGVSDSLRLKRPLADLVRMVVLHEGAAWTSSDQSPTGITLTPSREFVRERRDRRRRAAPATTPLQPAQAPVATPEVPAAFVYVDESRIADLRRLESADFDLRKLVAICDELNQCYRAQCYHAVAALTRALIDHVPPIFGMRSFPEVANNYAGSRSFRDSMRQLDTAARTISDQHLHTQIRAREALPTRVQVDFSQVVDVLLAEIVRLLHPRNAAGT